MDWALQGDQALSHRRWAGAGLALFLLALQVATAGPAEATRSLTVIPETGAPGSIAEVIGSGFIGALPVDLCWGESGCANLGTVLPSLSGDFSATITIPTSASSRTHRIHACQLSILGDLLCANAAFVVTTPPTTSTSTETTTPPSITQPPTTPTTAPTSTAPPPTTAPTTTIDNPSTSEPTPPSAPGGDDQDGPGGVTALQEVRSPAEDTPDAPDATVGPLPFLIYTPPQPSSSLPSGDPGMEQGKASDNSFFAIGETEKGWSLDSPIRFWTAWLIAVVAASGLLSIGRWWLQRRGEVDS